MTPPRCFRDGIAFCDTMTSVRTDRSQQMYLSEGFCGSLNLTGQIARAEGPL